MSPSCKQLLSQKTKIEKNEKDKKSLTSPEASASSRSSDNSLSKLGSCCMYSSDEEHAYKYTCQRASYTSYKPQLQPHIFLLLMALGQGSGQVYRKAQA